MKRDGLPRSRHWDATVPLLMDPYRFISSQCQRLGSSVFLTRLMLEPTICMSGAAAAELFYDEGRFQRQGAMLGRVRKTLLGEGGVQGLDDVIHRHRRAMFLRILGEPNIQALRQAVTDEWESAAATWQGDPVILYDEARAVLCRAACRWAGVPLGPDEEHRRTDQITALFQYAGTVGLKHHMARHARSKCEAWTGEAIGNIRAGRLELDENRPAAVVALHRDAKGRLLDQQVAAVELLNILRPITAIAVFVTHLGHALANYEIDVDLLRTREGLRAFVQEVRRFYPFFPAIVARVRREFDWQGYTFAKGRRVLLDLYGTNHDPSIWTEPEHFRPDRFLHLTPSAFEFLPQGGGDFLSGHRCAGEPVTIELMADAAEFLAGRQWRSPPEYDHRINMRRVPALPNDGLAIQVAAA